MSRIFCAQVKSSYQEQEQWKQLENQKANWSQVAKSNDEYDYEWK